MPIKDGMGRVGCLTHAWLVELQQVHPFSVFAYEEPTGSSSGDNEAILSAAMTIAIAAHLESYCHHQGVSCRSVSIGAWRRTLLGKGVGESAKTFNGWMRKRLEEFGWWRLKRREEQDACGVLDHLILLGGRHTPPWREKELADLQAPVAAAGGRR
jgi:hypothetical protein